MGETQVMLCALMLTSHSKLIDIVHLLDSYVSSSILSTGLGVNRGGQKMMTDELGWDWHSGFEAMILPSLASCSLN